MRFRTVIPVRILASLCVITGLPLFCAEPTNPYTQPPTGLRYTDEDVVLVVGDTLGIDSLLWRMGPPERCSVAPALPPGLMIDSVCGHLYGVALERSARKEYIVTVSNAYGQATVSLHVTVNPLPPGRLSYHAESFAFVAGHEVNSACPTLEGGPADSFYVSPSLPTGLTIDPDSGCLRGTPTGITNGARVHTVTAWNVSGSANVNIAVQVTEPDTFQIIVLPSPNGTILPSGSGSIVRVPAGGSTTFTFTPDSGYVLSRVLVDGLSVDSAALSGTYQVSGITESHTLGAEFVRIAPLEITYQPVSRTVFVGDSVSIRVGARGHGHLTYQWYDTAGALPGLTDSLVVFPQVALGDSGNYYCIVHDVQGQADTSAICTLRVTTTPVPLRILNQPHAGPVTVGDTITLLVTAEGSAISYRWYHDGNPLTAGTGAALTLRGVTLADSGDYYVLLTTTDSTCRSDTVHLTVKPLMHAITVVAGTGGSIEPAGRDGVVSVADGASQTFTMTPESGYSIQSVFVDGQRSEAATATGQHIFTSVRRDHTISAAFNKRRYTLVVVASPADGGTTEGGGTIDHGDTVAIAATPSPGYYFGGWRKATGAAVIFGNTADYSTFVVLEQGDATVEARFTAYPAAAPPRVAPPGGTYSDSVVVSISCRTAEAAVHYTTDERVPDSTSPRYNGPFSVREDCIVHAIAYRNGYLPSTVVSAAYTINHPPQFSKAGAQMLDSVGVGNAYSDTVTVSDQDAADENTVLLAQRPDSSFTLTWDSQSGRAKLSWVPDRTRYATGEEMQVVLWAVDRVDTTVLSWKVGLTAHEWELMNDSMGAEPPVLTAVDTEALFTVLAAEPGVVQRSASGGISFSPFPSVGGRVLDMRAVGDRLYATGQDAYNYILCWILDNATGEVIDSVNPPIESTGDDEHYYQCAAIGKDGHVVVSIYSSWHGYPGHNFLFDTEAYDKEVAGGAAGGAFHDIEACDNGFFFGVSDSGFVRRDPTDLHFNEGWDFVDRSRTEYDRVSTDKLMGRVVYLLNSTTGVLEKVVDPGGTPTYSSIFPKNGDGTGVVPRLVLASGSQTGWLVDVAGKVYFSRDGFASVESEIARDPRGKAAAIKELYLAEDKKTVYAFGTVDGKGVLFRY